MSYPDDLPEEISAGNLHEYLYQLTLAVCRDKEYVYQAYASCFCEISSKIFNQGATNASGETTLYGIKSDYDVHISWAISRRVNFIKFNCVEFLFDIQTKIGEKIRTFPASFELSHGSLVR
jgi:hypothetical protein